MKVRKVSMFWTVLLIAVAVSAVECNINSDLLDLDLLLVRTSSLGPDIHLSDTDYHQMPALHKLDEYDRCLDDYEFTRPAIYCLVKTVIKPDNDSDVWRLIQVGWCDAIVQVIASLYPFVSRMPSLRWVHYVHYSPFLISLALITLTRETWASINIQTYHNTTCKHNRSQHNIYLLALQFIRNECNQWCCSWLTLFNECQCSVQHTHTFLGISSSRTNHDQLIHFMLSWRLLCCSVLFQLFFN